MERIEKAQRWAQEGHKGVNRKHSDLPYIVHPEAVAQIIAEITDDPDVIAAAWLHDVIEDTEKTVENVSVNFNDHIAQMVYQVSKVSRKGGGNRKVRVAADRVHYAQGSKWAKAIKIADMIHNMPTMIRDNPDFAPKYVKEKEDLLDVIQDGSPLLASIARNIIDDFRKSLTPIDVYGSIREITE
jgi:(p)ppGpp synthase/HD superfamily hydrolase